LELGVLGAAPKLVHQRGFRTTGKCHEMYNS
jgi:hypothetical protein